MRKILAALLAITMLLTTAGMCTVPVSAEDVAATDVIYSEDFETYSKDINWLTALDSNGYVTADSDNIKAQSWTIYGQNFEDGLVEVAADPVDANNQVLKISTGTMQSGDSYWYRVRKNSADDNTGISRSSMTSGKKLVIETDIYTSYLTQTASDNKIFDYDNAKHTSRYGTSVVSSTGGGAQWYLAGVGGDKYGRNTMARIRDALSPYSTDGSKDRWTNVKYVIDVTAPTSDTRPADTVRAYKDDIALTYSLGNEGASTDANGNYTKTHVVNELHPQPATNAADGAKTKVIDSWGAGKSFTATTGSYLNFGDFLGTGITVSQKSGYTDQVYYIDNLKAYWIDVFKQEGEIDYGNVDESGRWYSGGIEIPFNVSVQETVKELYATPASTKYEQHPYKEYTLSQLLNVVDAETGKIVEGGIKSASLKKDNDKVLIVEPNSVQLETGKQYKIMANPLFRSVDGQGLNSFSKETNIATFTMGVDPYAHIIYSETFNDYEANVEWLPKSSGLVTANGDVEGKWSVVYGSGYEHKGSVKVVTDAKNADNQVLAITPGSSSLASYTGWLNIRRNAVAGGQSAISRASMSDGKKLVYEVKVRAPKGFKGEEVSFLSNSSRKTTASSNDFSGSYTSIFSNGVYVRTAGTYWYPQTRAYTNPYDGEWHTLRVINDVSKPLSEAHSDTSRALFDDVLYTGYYTSWANNASDPADELASASLYNKDTHGTRWFTQNANYPVIMKNDTTRTAVKQIDYLPSGIFQNNTYLTMGDFWGNQFTAMNPSTVDTANNTYYIDDLTAYWIDALTVSSPNASNFVGGTIKLNFNQEIRDKVSEKENGVNDLVVHELKDLIVIIDESDEVVENGIAGVKLSEDKKTISIAPGAGILANNSYKIVISPLLIDIYGQGLKNNSTETVIDLSVGEFQPFKLTNLSQETVSGFSKGRDVKVVAEFSVDIDEEIIKNGVTVKNTDTNEVIAINEGWTASFVTDPIEGPDFKKVEFDFGGLETANYEITSNELFVLDGEALLNPFKITITKANEIIELFNETFETGYTVGDNWIKEANIDTDLSGSNGSTYNYTVDDHKWDIQIEGTGNDTSNAVVKVINVNDITDDIDYSDRLSGNVLYISNPDATAYNKGIISIRRNFDKLNGISLTNGEYDGKELVVEADIIVPSSFPWESPFLSLSSTKKVDGYTARGYGNMFLPRTSSYRVEHGAYSEASYGPVNMWHPTTAKGMNGNAKIKVVYDQSNDLVDTMRVYVNDEVVSTTISAALEGHEICGDTISDFAGKDYTGGKWRFGDVTYGVWNNIGNVPYYIDNFKAYLVDAFRIEAVSGNSDVFNTQKGEITYTFTSAVDETSIDNNVVLLDDRGDVVRDGIRTAVLSDGGYKLTVKLADELLGAKKYTIKLKDGIKSADGLALSREYSYYDDYNIDVYYTKDAATGKYTVTYNSKNYECELLTDPADGRRYLYYDRNGADRMAKCYIDCYTEDEYKMKTMVDITTAKSVSVYADATAILDDNNVSSSVQFVNPTDEALNVWCIVAAYGEYNEMIGASTPIVRTIDANTKTEAQELNFTTTSADIESVKLFVLNSITEFVPYQKVETLFAK